MLKAVAFGAAALTGIVLAFAATRPDNFRVQRSASIKASPEQVFAHINDLRRFNAWNPFEKKDPNLKGSYDGAASGKGATYAFDGNGNVGSGRLSIIESVPAREVRMTLDMGKPMEGHNIVEFNLRPDGDSTRVTWAIQGPMPYISKLMSLVCDMDAMIGREFESGLENLRAIVER